MMHKNPKAMREALAAALAGGTQRPNPATGTMQTDGPMVRAPAVWQSAPNHPPTMLAYITPDEAALLAKKDMHNSGVDEKPHFGPNGIPSFNGYDGSGGYSTGGDESGGGPGSATGGAGLGADGSYTGAGGMYSDVNAGIAGTAGQSGGQLVDMSVQDQGAIGRGGLIAGPAEVGLSGFGAVGRGLGRAADRAIDNPVATGINTVASMALGPVGALNSISGLFGGPTIGGAITGAFGGGSRGGAQTASSSPSASGSGGPLGSNDSPGNQNDGGSGASGAGGPLSRQPGANSTLANALLGNSPLNQGRMTYGALVSSFDPNGRRYVTPWAARG